MNVVEFNRKAWDKQVTDGCAWTLPVTTEQVDAARKGDWYVVLTPTVHVPRAWFPSDLNGSDILCLASGGGQQGPILAAAGANVTVLDVSPKQLERDRQVAERDGLKIHTVQGNMADLSAFADGVFDVVFNPVSTPFVPDVRQVWVECARVLRTGGVLLTGFIQPHIYCLDERDGLYYLRFSLPYSDLHSISEEERIEMNGADSPLEFSHTFSDLIGGQLAAGLQLVDMYEDVRPNEPLSKFLPRYMATRAVKA